ncbi:MAG: spore photoproduct lyase family protein [Candidatus Neomarinimicrobiota bacterium]
MANRFTHIYVERQAREYPFTQRILKKFPAAVQIEINNYRDIFQRANQQFLIQKQNPNLILAVKRDGLIYRGSPECQDFNNPNFYYSTPVLNCIYDCEYCYLQGKYQSANLVVFVNQADLMTAVGAEIDRRPDRGHPLLLALSYDTDLLALDNRLALITDWIEFARSTDDLLLEIRTKSAVRSLFSRLKPTGNILFSWTLSPASIITSYEHLTPALGKRLAAVRAALNQGWQVRLCIDPLIYSADWSEVYGKFVEHLFSVLPPAAIYDVHYGPFRMNDTFFKRLQKLRPGSKIFNQPLAPAEKVITLPLELQLSMTEIMGEYLAKYLPAQKIHPWN